jgi:hypothetical protein
LKKTDGWIYVLINEAMPELVKVGCTSKNPVIRAKQLSGETGVPTSFLVIYAAWVSNYEQSEKNIHDALKSDGLHHNKEFFRCDPYDAIYCIRENADILYEDYEDYELEDDEVDQLLHDFEEIRVLKGREPYIKYNGKIFAIPREIDPKSLNKMMCEMIIVEAPPPNQNYVSGERYEQFIQELLEAKKSRQ